MSRSTAVLLGVSCALSAPVLLEGSSAEPPFIHLAEGFTAADETTGIEAAYRMFTAPTFADVCAPLEAPDRLLVVGAEPLKLDRDEWFPYDRLTVLALDAAGKVLPRVPISVEVEQVKPPVLSLRSDMTAHDRVLPIREGGFRFRFRTICDGRTVATSVQAEVVAP